MSCTTSMTWTRLSALVPAGALQDDINVMDVVIAMGACTDSNFASQFKLPGTFAPTASYELLARAVEVAKEQGTPVRVGNVVSSDVFYSDDPGSSDACEKDGCALRRDGMRGPLHERCPGRKAGIGNFNHFGSYVPGGGPSPQRQDRHPLIR